MNKNYQMALSEVYTIINQYDNETKNKISSKFVKFIEENRDKTYNPEFDVNIHLKDLKIRKETKGILAIIYRNYFCNIEKKQEFDNLLRENDKKMQEYLSQKYDVNKLFEKREEISINKIEETKDNGNYLIEIDRINWCIKIINKIKKFLQYFSKKR